MKLGMMMELGRMMELGMMMNRVSASVLKELAVGAASPPNRFWSFDAFEEEGLESFFPS